MERGAGCARTPNHVRRSSTRSRQSRHARSSTLVRLLALSALGPTVPIRVQRAYGTMGTSTLLVLRLLGGAWSEFGRRGAKNWFGGARSSAGAFPTARLLQGRWVRRRRTGHLRSFLLRRHVDEDDGGLARADAGSGSHNLYAPYLARQRCRGKSASSITYGDGTPFRFGGERRMHEEQIEATRTHKDFTQLRAARMRKTLLLLVWIDSSSCSGAQEATVSLELDVGGCLLGVLLSYVAWASFYMLKGLPTGSDAGEGKKGKGLCVQCCTVLSYLLLTAGDKGIKCPSRSLGQHRGGPLGAPPFATMAVACHRTPQAARCLATCLRESPKATRGQVSWSAGLRW